MTYDKLENGTEVEYVGKNPNWVDYVGKVLRPYEDNYTGPSAYEAFYVEFTCRGVPLGHFAILREDLKVIKKELPPISTDEIYFDCYQDSLRVEFQDDFSVLLSAKDYSDDVYLKFTDPDAVFDLGMHLIRLARKMTEGE